MKKIEGGVCAPIGFTANGVHCGIRKNKSKKDLALIFSDCLCNAASVYTTNLVKGAPIKVTKKNLLNGKAQAIICNSGNANTCNANGVMIAKAMCALVGDSTGISESDVIVASTGVIGQPLEISPIKINIKNLVDGLGKKNKDASLAILTTDTIEKTIAYSFDIDGLECKIGGIAKGSGMIHPNMATMLVFLTTDCAISNAMLQKALSEDVKTSFNMLSVDGDTSTNDMLSIMANGKAKNKIIDSDGEDFKVFKKVLSKVTTSLCKMIAKDGEGASKMIECKVVGATDDKTAQMVSKSIVTSDLVKTAIFGSDANWGRILCAIGYSGTNLDIDKIDVTFGSKQGQIEVCKNGTGVLFDEIKAKKILLEDEIEILVNLNSGNSKSTAWGCDLTYDYVKINGDYRT